MQKFFSIAIFLVAIIFTATVSAEGIWRLDGTNNNDLPRNFRVIDDLKISGSGQPSPNELEFLYSEIRQKTDGNIYIVDLREESHGFANGFSISYYTEKNLANFFKPRDKIESIEFEQLTDILDRRTDFLPLGNEDKKLFKPVNVLVKNVETERQKADEIGFIYARFPVTDIYFPTSEVVDDFINFVANLKENDWVHFHCQAGHGRTSTFMIMYEILKNPKKTLEEISERQIKLGGSDLLTRRNGNAKDYYVEAHNSRADKLEKFYNYVNKFYHGDISTSWAEYVKQK